MSVKIKIVAFFKYNIHTQLNNKSTSIRSRIKIQTIRNYTDISNKRCYTILCVCVRVRCCRLLPYCSVNIHLHTDHHKQLNLSCSRKKKTTANKPNIRNTNSNKIQSLTFIKNRLNRQH